MSQIQSFGLGGVIPPVLLETLTADDTSVIAPIANNINVFGRAFPLATGFAFTQQGVTANTLAVLPLSNSVTSNDDTFTTLALVPIPVNASAILHVTVTGIKSDFTVCAGGVMAGISRNTGAGATVPKSGGSILSDKAVGPFPSGRMMNVGNNLEFQVRGAQAGDVYNWIAHIEYQVLA